MDEAVIYFQDAQTHTVGLTGRRHIIMKSIGFASMRVTIIASTWAGDRIALPTR
jgi:hypothetical protein